jgi:hypothetical protein
MNRIVLATLLVFLARPVSAVEDRKSAVAEVIFDHPENFTDVKDRYDATESGRKAILDDLSGFIVRTARYYVPEGDKLTITFQDIDLAGEFEPWRGPEFDDVRIIKDIYPPAFKFAYKVTDAAGRVLKEGKEHIRDLNFQMRITADRDDPLHYEKDILQDWMRQKLRDLKKP